jgi:hypothetical protein
LSSFRDPSPECPIAVWTFVFQSVRLTPVFASWSTRAVPWSFMERPVRFEHTRYLGDKRTQLVYDLDEWHDESVIAAIVAEEVGICFGPDTLAEARNRGYSLATAGKRRVHRKPRA